MKQIKLMFILMLFALPWNMAMADKYSQLGLEVIIKCYEQIDPQNTDKSLFSRCIQAKLDHIPNPLDYNLHIHSDNPVKGSNAKLKIFMVNNSGGMIYCIATMGKKLTIDSCASDKGVPLTPSQSMSVDKFL